MQSNGRRQAITAGAGSTALLAGIPFAPRAETAADGIVRVGDIAFGAGRPKSVVSVTGGTSEAMLSQGRALSSKGSVDLVELRLDRLAEAPDPAGTVRLIQALSGVVGGKPILATLRSRREGGAGEIAADRYAALHEAIAGAGDAALLDIELAMPESPAVAAMAGVLEAQAARGANICILAVMPGDAGDVLKLLEATWTMRRHSEQVLITMAMGGAGLVSRLSGEVFGSAASFGSVGTASAPGQIDVEALRGAIGMISDAVGTDR